MGAQGLVNFVVKPSVVTELESSTQILGQRVEKCDKASNVLSEVGWQLEKNGAETVAEYKGGFEEGIEHLMDVFESTKMGDAPSGTCAAQFSTTSLFGKR
jgi:hypothetical protein